MFDLRSTDSVIRSGPVASALAGLVLLLVLVASITALAASMPDATAEVGDNRHYMGVVPVPEYPNVSPTAHSVWD